MRRVIAVAVAPGAGLCAIVSLTGCGRRGGRGGDTAPVRTPAPAAPADAPAANTGTLDDILRDLDTVDNMLTQVETGTSAGSAAEGQEE